ncbi:hypothetical protein ABK040_005460 [Willaertia magna]
MSSVFIAGAGGYIGQGVTFAFRRAGFRVYGLVRSQSKASVLLKNEIIPIVADLQDVNAYKDVLVKCSVIVDAVGMGEHTELFLNAVNDAGKTRNEDVDKTDIYKPLYIFTSGIMTYGNASNGPLDESVRPKPTHKWTEDRRLFENKVLMLGKKEDSFIRTVVVRPGFVFGRNGGPIATQFFSIPKDKDLVLYGAPNKRWSWVHVDDLGEGYTLIARAGSVVDSQLFNLAAVDNPTYLELRLAMAKVAGWKEENHKVEYSEIPEDDVGTQVFENTGIINPAKAFDVLNWRPRTTSFLSEIDIYYQSWLASQQNK